MNYEELEKLQELKEKGILTDEEFQKEKQKILNDTKNESDSNNNVDTQAIKNEEVITNENLKINKGSRAYTGFLYFFRTLFIIFTIFSIGSKGMCITFLILTILTHISIKQNEKATIESETIVKKKENKEKLKKTKETKETTYIVAGCLFLIFLIGCVSLFSDNANSVVNNNTNKNNVSTTQTNTLKTYQLETTIQEITKTYSENYINGQKQYLNKRIKISAPIYDIQYEHAGIIGILAEASQNNGVAKDGWAIIVLKENGIDTRIRCSFENGDSTGITELKEGDTITIIGKLENVTGNLVGLYDCIIAK